MLDRGARWVYDIQMKDNPHTFFANGVLVHNSLFARAPHGY
jgi:intein/homing endonuclease